MCKLSWTHRPGDLLDDTQHNWILPATVSGLSYERAIPNLNDRRSLPVAGSTLWNALPYAVRGANLAEQRRANRRQSIPQCRLSLKEGAATVQGGIAREGSSAKCGRRFSTT